MYDTILRLTSTVTTSNCFCFLLPTKIFKTNEQQFKDVYIFFITRKFFCTFSVAITIFAWQSICGKMIFLSRLGSNCCCFPNPCPFLRLKGIDGGIKMYSHTFRARSWLTHSFLPAFLSFQLRKYRVYCYGGCLPFHRLALFFLPRLNWLIRLSLPT